MGSISFTSFWRSWNSANWSATICVVLLSALAFAARKIVQRSHFPETAPKPFDVWPVVGSLRWFTERAKFMQDGARAGPGHFSFYVGKNRVVGLSGETGRKIFFESKELELGRGYTVLLNAIPKIEDNNTEESFNTRIIRDLGRLLRKDSLARIVPALAADTSSAMAKLAARPVRIMDPFEDLYRLVYQLTMRTVGCDEIADDPDTLMRTLRIFEKIEGSSAPMSMAVSIVFPWLPTLRSFHMLLGGTQFYMITSRIVEGRKKTGVRKNDAMQMLIDRGDDVANIVRFIIASLFAGLINSGINAAWLVVFLADDPHWYSEIRKEVDGVVERYRTSPDESPLAVLSRLDFDAFDAGFPLIDVALQETIRHVVPGCVFRYNSSGRDVEIGDTGRVVPRDTFAAYLLDDIHFDQTVYRDPQRWDPGRFLPDRAEGKAPSHAFLGWGSGRHPCRMKFARLEMAMMVAFFMCEFDFERCNKDGSAPTTPLQPVDRQTVSASKPSTPVHIKYRPRR